MTRYDVCVVGAGLFGSATAKYLALKGARILLIGPEKCAREDTNQRDIFDCWSDVTRISHTLTTDVFWAHVAIESIKRYRSLEEESGVSFFTDTGYLVLSDSSSYIKDNINIAHQVGLDSLEVFANKSEVEKRYLGLQFAPDATVEGVAEPKNSGLINPIKLVEAQRALFVKGGGGAIVDDTVKVIRSSSEGFPFTLETHKGQTFQADKVVVCAGAFVGHNKLLPDGCRLDIQYRPSVYFRLRINPGPNSDSIMAVPPLIFMHPSKPAGESIYTAPPILYSDGHYYLKIGFFDDTSKFESTLLKEPSAVTEVFKPSILESEEIQANGRRLHSIATSLFKGLQSTIYAADTCCCVVTPSGRPYIGSVAPNWFVVTGDNGTSAKSSDEIGRLASELILKGEWTCPFATADDVRVKLLP